MSRTPDCVAYCAEPVECAVCHRTKAPRGRSVALAMAGALCDTDCRGYYEIPLPGHLWPSEWDESVTGKPQGER